MVEPIQDQMNKLRCSIAGLEAQRTKLGDAIVEPALAALRHQLSSLEEQAIVQSTTSEERRLVTVLFTDIVGSTSMAEKLDPEEWRQVVARFQAALGEAIVTHHGAIAQYLGDGLLAFFGARQASEHDPENAIRAALDGQAAVANLFDAQKLPLRSGVHTGLVVVGELGVATHKEFTACGDTMNLAARLQAAAPPGGVLISHDTYRYVRGVFDLTPQPPLTVKGKSVPLQTYLVRRAKPQPFRRVTRGVAGIETHTIGREAETGALQATYLQAYESHQIVWTQLLSEPGVGKSRLMMDLADWIDLRPETSRLLRARAFPDDSNQPFALVRRMWFDRFQIPEDETRGQMEARWVQRFEEYYHQDDWQEAARALGLLVGLSFDGSPYVKGMRNDPAQVKARALVVSHELINILRQEYPVVVLLEDLQWVDDPSWEYLVEVFLSDETGRTSGELPDYISNRHPNGVLILGAARLEWRPPEQLVELFKDSSPAEIAKGIAKQNTLLSAGNEKCGRLIQLAPLSNKAMYELVKELLQRVAEIPKQIVHLLVERSEGVPYYAEELVNWFIDHGILDTHGEQWRFSLDRLKEQPLPITLQHLLLTRLDSLSQVERAALQRGSIFGRRFWAGGLEALGVSAGAEMLERLQSRGLVELQTESTFPGDTEWSFHQNLLQEVTYESILKRERAALHRAAAGWLEGQARQASRLDEFSGLLGRHYERAGELNTSANWCLRAGKRAMSQGAPGEAAAFFSRALELLPPVDHARRWQALLGQEEALAIGGDAEPWKAGTTALVELARVIDDDQYLAEACLRQAIYGVRTDDEPLSVQACRESLAAARRCGNEAIQAKALALTALLGNFESDKSAKLEQIEEALRLARSLGDENVLAFVLFRVAYFYWALGDLGRSDAFQLEQIELDHRLGNRIREARGIFNLGAAYINGGLYKQARLLLEQAIAIEQAFGARQMLAYSFIALAQIYKDTGDLRKARQFAEEAHQNILPSRDTTGIMSCLLILGEVLLAMDDAPGAARRFNEGLEFVSKFELFPMVKTFEAGLAFCALAQGQLDEAQYLVHRAWDHLREHGWSGMRDPIFVYRGCADTFDALGDQENYRAVVEIAHQEIMKVADTMGSRERRQAFLENHPERRALIEMWERMQT